MDVPRRDLTTLFEVGATSGRSDGQLLEHFAASRDEAVFETLVGRHGPMVWGVCRRLLRDPHDAEDAFQATFLVLARKAAAIAHRELLAGWLHAVARRTATRARAIAARRRAREQQVVPMPEPEAPSEDRGDDLLAILDEELARLPDRFRTPIVLCDLEGKTQQDAASRLGCPPGTVSSRLSRGRAMLARRLARRGVTLAAGSLAAAMAREAESAIVPAGLAGSTARAAHLIATRAAAGAVSANVMNLTGEVLKAMLLSRLKFVLPLLLAGAGLVWSGARVVGAGPWGRIEAPAQAQTPPVVKAMTPATPKWAHLTSDTDYESWVRLEDGRYLWKSGDHAGVYDPASRTELTYRRGGPIVRIPDIEESRSDGEALERAGVRPLEPDEMGRRMTAKGRRIEGGNFASDAEVVELDGRRCLRIDMSTADALGNLRLAQQTWYDVETRRPIRRRDRLQLSQQTRYKREFGTMTITYGETGPADLYALGVPAETKIIDEETYRKVETPPSLQQALEGAARGIERLPRSLRIVDDDSDRLQLTWWLAPEGYVEATAAYMRDRSRGWSSYRGGKPRSFLADHQSLSGGKIPGNLRTPPGEDLRADALAAWLPIKESVNVRLHDSERAYDLTRTVGETGKSRQVLLHVHRGVEVRPLPLAIEATWEFAFDNRRFMKIVPAEPGTPRGCVTIQVDYPQTRRLYDVDPEHGHAVARKVAWSGDGRLKFRTDSKAVRWAQLPGGAWYVSEWQQLHHLDRFDAAGKPEPQQQPDFTTIRRVVITPMTPDQFPAGIFDGQQFLDEARKEGATIQVD
ncbi:RNA polymerase sigma factor [Aquisphaera insulae]|uniref:RNA polymerase sigma factor n=1 Tax=Aquisphaera insulae TaxID=2712864 RepID=UPI0013EDDC16|nr:RNA polymerase sigma factor [Aquisphaera insulae]